MEYGIQSNIGFLVTYRVFTDDAYYHTCYPGFTMARRVEATRAVPEGILLRRVVKIQFYALQDQKQVDETRSHCTREEQIQLR